MMMKHFRALGIATTFLLVTQAASALMVPIGLKGIRFPPTYPKSAQQQLRSALETDRCKFLQGCWINGHVRLQFGGDTNALNAMLKRLADCPGTSLTVSFWESDERGAFDWTFDCDQRSMKLQVIVNLKSKNIALDRLELPARQGPSLESTTTPANE